MVMKTCEDNIKIDFRRGGRLDHVVHRGRKECI
jgi:hypothetical protein